MICYIIKDQLVESVSRIGEKGNGVILEFPLTFIGM